MCLLLFFGFDVNFHTDLELFEISNCCSHAIERFREKNCLFLAKTQIPPRVTLSQPPFVELINNQHHTRGFSLYVQWYSIAKNCICNDLLFTWRVARFRFLTLVSLAAERHVLMRLAFQRRDRLNRVQNYFRFVCCFDVSSFFIARTSFVGLQNAKHIVFKTVYVKMMCIYFT